MIVDVSCCVASNNHNCLEFQCSIATFSKCHQWIPESSHYWKNVIFSGIPSGDPSSFVREKVCHFTQVHFVHCIVLYLWLYTSLCIQFWIHLWNFPLLWAKPYWHHFWNEIGNSPPWKSWAQDQWLNSIVDGTISIHNYYLFVEYEIFSLCHLAEKLIQQFPEEADFSCRFTFHFHCWYSKDVPHGRVVYKKDQCF